MKHGGESTKRYQSGFNVMNEHSRGLSSRYMFSGESEAALSYRLDRIGSLDLTIKKQN